MVDFAAAGFGWIRTVDAGRRTAKRHSGSATGRFGGWRSGAAGRFQPDPGVVKSTIYMSDSSSRRIPATGIPTQSGRLLSS
jgi:hypothetical protein